MIKQQKNKLTLTVVNEQKLVRRAAAGLRLSLTGGRCANMLARRQASLLSVRDCDSQHAPRHGA